MTRRYLYCYQTVVSFSCPVTNHAVLLRCRPVRGEYITVDEEHLITPPGYRMRPGRDAFGNRLVCGGRREGHSSFAYVSTGIVTMSPYEVGRDRLPTALWLMPSRLTALPDSLPAQLRDLPADAAAICHAVNGALEYAPGVTDVGTSAADALALGRGVCQDYAHVMVALCRRAGLAARYACGFLAGTGSTHAWVEVLDGGGWRGYDPTHDTRIEYGYMKIAHGRDASDCPVNRGMYVGGAEQETMVNVTMVDG